MKKELLLVLLTVTSFVQINAQTLPRQYVITADTATKQLLQNNYWQVLQDENDKFNIDDVQREPLANQFANFTKDSKEDFAKTTWFRFNIKNSASKILKLSITSDAAVTDFYIPDGNGVMHHFTTGTKIPWRKKNGFKKDNAIPFEIKPEEQILIFAKTIVHTAYLPNTLHFSLFNTEKLKQALLIDYQDNYTLSTDLFLMILSGIFLLAAIFNFLIFFTVREKVYLYFSITSLFASMSYLHPLYDVKYVGLPLSLILRSISYLWAFFLFHFVRRYLQVSQYYPRWNKWLLIISWLFLTFICTNIFLLSVSQYGLLKNSSYYFLGTIAFITDNIFWISFIITITLFLLKRNQENRVFLIGVLPFTISILLYTLVQISAIFIVSLRKDIVRYSNFSAGYLNGVGVLWLTAVISWVLFKRYAFQEKRIMQEKLEKEQLAKEQEIENGELIAKQNIELEKRVIERTYELKQSLEELKSTQSQLIQSEKMASLGELTAGIAHEIQNPLNFVNNFSEVNKELINEMQQEIDKGNYTDAKEISNDIKENSEKINHHGKRASDIVKGMLQHSRTSTGVKEPTDINALADEYLRLSYHGLRAKDKEFNAEMIPIAIGTDFDNSIGKINIIPQDIGRVLLNLYNNAFYAVNEKKRVAGDKYAPTVSVSTKKINDKIEISVKDNGSGIPQKVVDKIFQPFFTTKPTGSGTGLGLSLSYDIVKAQGGEIKVESKEGEGSEFIFQLPI